MNSGAGGFTLYWRIENFDEEPPDDFNIKSQIFKIHSLNANWYIEISAEEECLEAYLFKETNAVPFIVHYSVSLLTGSGWITVLDNARNKFRAGGQGDGGDIVNLERLKREKWFYLPNGSLTLSFHMWNNHIRNECSQRLMISRLINGEYLVHRRIQTFSTLSPTDLFSFPLSYEFQGNSASNLDYQNAKEVKTQHTQTHANFNSDSVRTFSTPNELLSFPVLCEIQGNAASNSDSHVAREVKTQHTQTDASFNFKDLDDLRQLFKEKEFSFVTLRTATREFSVHKAVLCAKSPVFNAMFERKMKENDSNVVDIDDIDNQTMALFVDFLHFDPLEDLKWNTAISLYYPADKYQIDSLKEICVSLLKKELSTENVCDVLVLADLHQDIDLMNFAQEYFCKNSKAIFLSTKWNDILGHTDLISKLLRKLAESMH